MCSYLMALTLNIIFSAVGNPIIIHIVHKVHGFIRGRFTHIPRFMTMKKLGALENHSKAILCEI